MSNATETFEDQAEYQDDEILLDGQPFLVDGPIRGTAISEFATGLKIGQATYDEREHAFFLELNDFTGGFAHRVLNVREALGTHYDNKGGVDLRRSKHITLPAKRVILDADNDPSNITLWYGDEAALGSDLHTSAGKGYFGAGGAIYTTDYDTNTGMRSALTRQAQLTNTNRIRRILEFTGSDQKRGIYVSGNSTGSFDNAYHRNTTAGDVTAFDKAVAAGPGAGEFDTSGLVYISDMIVFDGNIVAQTLSNEITSSADGSTWQIDDSVNNDPIYRAGGFIQFIGIAMAPWGAPAPYFIDQGKLHVLHFYGLTAFKIEDVGEQNFLLQGTSWNGSLFITDSQNVWEYSPGTRETVRHLGPFGRDGAPPSWVEGSYEITQFLPGTSHLFALCRSIVDNKGRLLVWQGTGWSWFGPAFPGMPISGTVNRLPVNLSLNQPTRYIDVIATDQQNTATGTAIHSFKLPTVGDIPFVRNEGDPGSIAARTFFENGPLQWETGWYDGGFSDIQGVLHKIKLDGFHMSKDNTCQVEYRLDNDEAADYTNLGTFVNNQHTLWFDDKEHLGIQFTTVQFRFTLNRLTMANNDSGETTAEEVDISETAIDVSSDAAFAALDVITIDSEDMLVVSKAANVLTVIRGYNGSTAATHATATAIFDNFENPTPTQMNASGTGPGGISDVFSRSPEVKSMVLVFEKVPELRTAWTCRIDLSRMKEQSVKIDHEEASLYGYWQFLKRLRNKKPLVQLFIPSLESTINVRIADFPGTFNDFRESIAGEGFVDLQMLEPISEE